MLKKDSFQFLRHYKYLHFGKQTADVQSFLVPPGMNIIGDITGECKGRIDGNFSGKINISDKLIIGKTATIYGYIFASEIMIFGKVEGEIFSRGKVSIMNGAVINGDVFANNFVVEENAVVEGNLKKQTTDDLLKIFAAKYKHLGLNANYNQELTQEGEILLSLPNKNAQISENKETNAVANNTNYVSVQQRTNNKWF